VILAINGRLAPLYAGKDFVLAGQFFKNGISLTRETLNAMSDVAEKEREKRAAEKALEKEIRAAFLKKNIKALDDFVALSYNPGQARDFFYVVTDPNCSHCRALLPKLELTAQESGMGIKVIIYPILGDPSRNMAMQAICNNYSYESYVNIKGVEPVPTCQRAENQVMNTIDFFRSAGLFFVPLVVAGDGSWVAEANHNTMVRDYLGLEPLGEETGPHATCNSGQEE
jgi:thiol:disulfide interchange protein DsbC